MLSTPVLMIIFNRPEHTRHVFDAVKKAKPTKLFVAADGPRSNNDSDRQLSKETKAIFDDVDWPCEIHTLYRTENSGCKHAVSSAITWFFENVEEGIILEDDCLPNDSFFTYCEILLDKYRDDDRIMHIAGTNVQDGNVRSDGSYYYSKICHVWGWASWRRAWTKYDIAMKSFEDFEKSGLINSLWEKEKDIAYWYRCFKRTYLGNINTWDYQWVYTIWVNNGLCIAPQVNLISNIGFDATATHTKNTEDYFSNHKTYVMDKVVHPTIMMQSKDADNFSMSLYTRKPPIKARIKNRLVQVSNIIQNKQ